MEDTRPKSQEVFIHTNLDELRLGTFPMPDEITQPIIELVFQAEVRAQQMRSRTRVSSEFIELAPEWKKMVGHQVLSSIKQPLTLNG